MYLTMFIVSRVILVLALASLATSSRTPEPLQMFAHSIEGTADEMKACHESSCKGHCSHTPHCVWCASEKLPSGCFHEAEAKLLPGMLYTCDAEQSMGPMQHMMGNVMGAMQHMMGNMMAAADPCEVRARALAAPQWGRARGPTPAPCPNPQIFGNI